MANSDEEKDEQSETPEEETEESAPEETTADEAGDADSEPEEAGAESSDADDGDDSGTDTSDAADDDSDDDADDEDAGEASDDGDDSEDDETADASESDDEDDTAEASDDEDDQTADASDASDDEDDAAAASDGDDSDDDDAAEAADDEDDAVDEADASDSEIVMSEQGLAPVSEYERSEPGMAAFFDHPDDLMEAARETRDSEYEEFDAFSPFPIHGMDEAMGLGRSWIPWVTFAAGMTGLLTAIALEFGTMTFDWPMIIGGKPFAPWPAFVPVMFELTVLIGGVTTGVVMLKAAGCFEPADVIDPDITNDRFALWISASDDHYDEQEAVEFARSLEPTEVRTYSEKADSDG